jgi:hypothetical protein
MSDLSAAVRIEGGKMTVRNRVRFAEAVKAAKDGDYILTLEREHARISEAQRGYYFGVIVDRLAVRLNLSPALTHQTLKAQFLPYDKAIKGENGTLVNGLVIGGSITKLNKLEFCDYQDRIVDHAAEHWDTYLPPPDPLWREHAEDEAARQEVA